MSPVMRSDTTLTSTSGTYPREDTNVTNGFPTISADAGMGKDTAAERYLRQNPDHPPATAARLYQPSRTETSIARLGYFSIVRTCLDLSKTADRIRMQRFIAQSLAYPVPAEISTNADLWRTLGQRALTEPMCSRKVLANGVRGRDADDLFRASSEQFSGLSNIDLSIDERDFVEDFIEFMPEDSGGFDATRNRLVSLAHGLLGNWYFRSKDYHNAVLEFDQALSGYGQCSEFRMRRGQALEALGDHKRGRADLKLVNLS